MRIKFENLISIEEECHGFIGYASSIERAIDFLIDKDYLHQYTAIYDHEAENWKYIPEIFGENWKESLKEMTLDDLNRVFDGYFYFNDKVELEIY